MSPRSLDSQVYSSVSSNKFDSPVYSLPGSRDSPVFSTQGIIDSLVYSLLGSQKFDSSVYSLPRSRNSPVYWPQWSHFTVSSCFKDLPRPLKEQSFYKINHGVAAEMRHSPPWEIRQWYSTKCASFSYCLIKSVYSYPPCGQCLRGLVLDASMGEYFYPLAKGP
jgi:hypothetical protein